MEKIRSIVLSAGTHGNELTGLYIQKLINEQLMPSARESFELEMLVANPEAVTKNVRYVDEDLNRLFRASQFEKNESSKEAQIARNLKGQYGDKEGQLIIDLHNTVSKMGATLILLSNDPFYLSMGAYVKRLMPNANILFEPDIDWSEQPYLCTVGHAGVMIEVEEMSHGVLTLESLDLMKAMLLAVLDYVDAHNRNLSLEIEDYDAYVLTEEISFPMDKQGRRDAVVHPTVCHRDFREVVPGEPIFSFLDGRHYFWNGSESTYPHFINEAAYSAQNIAMALSKKVRISVPE